MWNTLAASPISSFGEDESRQEISSASMELDGLLLSHHYFNTPQNYNENFHLEPISPSLPPSPKLPTTHYSNSFPEEHSSVISVPSTAQVQTGVLPERGKRMTTKDPTSKRPLGSRLSKKLKATCSVQLHDPPLHQSALPHSQSTKVPNRRNHKLGDKIAALQQLVSPFGKTDTASVLHEAAICIKSLQHQIQLQTAPYFGMQPSLHNHQALTRMQENNIYHLPTVKGPEGQKTNLRSRGLCLIPMSSPLMTSIVKQ